MDVHLERLRIGQVPHARQQGGATRAALRCRELVVLAHQAVDLPQIGDQAGGLADTVQATPLALGDQKAQGGPASSTRGGDC
ncbi:hypothetical protein GCM10020000_86010 [Streptomyces olivoverticillatus]